MKDVATEVSFTINGELKEGLALGRASTNFGGGITCEVEKVLIDGTDVYPLVDQASMQGIRTRLVARYISERMRGREGDVHEEIA